MRKLNQTAKKVFERLTEGLHEVGDHRKVANAEHFMPVCVEVIDQLPAGRVVSLAHYFEQHGDLCCDPDVTFLVAADGDVYPLTFQQAIPPIYTAAVECDETGPVRIRPGAQRELVSFANQWMKNIHAQQFRQ